MGWGEGIISYRYWSVFIFLGKVFIVVEVIVGSDSSRYVLEYSR